jgi:methionine sulfoxide reductase heme-binding subunit
MTNKKIDWLKILVHAGAVITLLVMAIRFFTNTLSVNPIQTLERQSGKTALIFLILSLACSPLGAILEWKDLSKRKKALGLYGFGFAAVHLLIYIGLDFGFRLDLIWATLVHTVYLWIGLAALIMLLALAVTSFKKMKQLMKKNWKPLHRLVYIISPLVVLHFFLSLKANLFRMQGNLRDPLIYGGIVILLLILRIPPVKRGLIQLRTRWQDRMNRPNPV